MLILVAIQFAILLTASVLLLLEVRAGSLDESSGKRPVLRAIIYLLASIAGATLLTVMADGEWIIALALAPITFLSLLRFATLARRWWLGWRLPLYTCAIVVVGICASLPLMPYPLNRTFVLEQLHLINAHTERPDTIDPEAVRTVRV